MGRKDGDIVSMGTPPLMQQPPVGKDIAAGPKCSPYPRTEWKKKEKKKKKKQYKGNLGYTKRKSIYPRAYVKQAGTAGAFPRVKDAGKCHHLSPFGVFHVYPALAPVIPPGWPQPRDYPGPRPTPAPGTQQRHPWGQCSPGTALGLHSLQLQPTCQSH